MHECPLCNRMLGTKGALTKHLTAHERRSKAADSSRSESNRIGSNTESFTTPQALTFVCPVEGCLAQFPERKSYRQHLLSHPASTKCQICQQVLANRNSLNLHMQLHDPQRPQVSSAYSDCLRGLRLGTVDTLGPQSPCRCRSSQTKAF